MVWAIAALAGAVAGSLGFGAGIERGLQDLRFEVRSRAASGDVHLVEIDARSIQAIERWPWPRRNHAALVERLDAAGAEVIAFDVDFSSRSNAADDAAFARALDASRTPVILPTLRQSAGGGRSGVIDSLPIPQLRRSVALAAVSVLPDGDGQVRQAPLGVVTAGVPRPSLSAMLSGRAGVADAAFPIDYAIDPATIPRHSFIDIRDGHFDPSALAGKRVIVGATAVENGDRYAVPRYGVIPGVVIQALAVETLARGVPIAAGWQGPLLLAMLLAIGFGMARSRVALGTLLAAAPMGMLAAAIACEAWWQVQFPIVPALIGLGVAGGGMVALRIAAAARARRGIDAATGLPNRVALGRDHPGGAPVAIATARIADFDRLVASIGPGDVAALVARICDRIALTTDAATLYRIEDRLLAWRVLEDAETIGDRFAALRATMLSPVEVAGRRIDVTLAMGFAEDEAGDALRAAGNAALAADQAIAAGESWQVHAAGSEASLEQELSLMSELDEAIDRGELAVVYQPKLDLACDRITSVEALVRWNHPARGFLSPDHFIPMAERNGRIERLTLAVVHQTIADLERWAAAGHAITGAVNLSANLVSDQAFNQALRELLADAKVDPAMLTFEITESAAMIDPEGVARALAEFRKLGVRISMDDYGTGQSTLTYIKQLPLDELKIDRMFVQFAHQDRGDAVLVRSTVALAHELGIKVVAEGIEVAECLAFLRAAGCDMAQGYFISRPLPPDALLALLASGERRWAA